MLRRAWAKFRSWPTWAQASAWVVLVIVVISAGASDDQTEVDTTAAPSTSTEMAEEPVTNQAPTTEAPTTTTTAAPEWIEVARLSGTAQKQGDTFQLEGGKVRARYEFDAGQFGIFAFYVMEEGDSLAQSGGIPTVTCTESCSDETLLRQPAGAYYLDVNASGGEWSVVIEEER